MTKDDSEGLRADHPEVRGLAAALQAFCTERSQQRQHAFRHEPRQTLSDQQKAKLFLDRDGRCHRCTRRLTSADRWTVEHVIALENGGTNDWKNLGISCSWCKPAKDAEDHAKAAKSRHVAVAHVIPPSQRQKRGPPMPGSKRSRWKKRMDGTVERR